MSNLKKIWIWFWYNDITRLFVVIIPSYFIILIPCLMMLGLTAEIIKYMLCIVYVFVFSWAIIDNDYSNLRKIGKDEYRRPLKEKDDCENCISYEEDLCCRNPDGSCDMFEPKISKG